MNTDSLYLVGSLALLILAALAASLVAGRKVPTARQRLQVALDGYRLRQIELEAALTSHKHALNATREHIKRLTKQLAKPDDSEATILHLVGRQAK